MFQKHHAGLGKTQNAISYEDYFWDKNWRGATVRETRLFLELCFHSQSWISEVRLILTLWMDVWWSLCVLRPSEVGEL